MDPSKPFPLASITVTGNSNFGAEQILEMSGLRDGSMVQKSDFDAAQRKLLESGLFETVAYKYQPAVSGGGYSAVLEVREIAQLFAYRFEAVPADDAALRSFLKEREPLFRDRIPPTEPVIKRFSSAVEAYLQKHAAPLTISGKLTPNASGALEIVFQPSSLPAVAEVHFTGNKVLPSGTLQVAIASVAVGALFTEERFRQLLDTTIRPLYEAEGRMRVVFPKLETRPASDVRGLAITVAVEENEPYKLSNVSISGPMSDDKGVLREGSFRTGDIVNMKAVGESVERIERSLKRRGYLSVSTKVDRKLNDQEKTVDLVVDVDPGPQYLMGQLTIEGLDIQTEPHIRKLWNLKPKQPFNFDYPDQFLAQMPETLDNLGKTKSMVRPDPGTLTVDVTLTFAPPEKQPKKDSIPGVR